MARISHWIIDIVQHSFHMSWPASEPAIHLRRAMRRGYVYILASRKNGTLYIGVTNNLASRVLAHKDGVGCAFTRKYGVTNLVWYEEHPIVPLAIQRETSLKRWKREWKIALIEKVNPNWNDLSAWLT
jgi:putative endonuclease